MLQFERILRKYFGATNREGLGFLETEIKGAAEEMEQLSHGYQQVITLTDSDVNPKYVLVKDMAIEDNEVSLQMLTAVHFIIPRKEFHRVDTVIYQGKFGQHILKHRPRVKLVNKTTVVNVDHVEEANVIEDLKQISKNND